MKMFKSLTAAVGIIAAVSAAPVAMADVPESTDPIRIVQNNWTSQLVLANVVGQLMQKMGYNVEYLPSDTQLQYTAIANGDMDLQIEVWEGSQYQAFKAALDTGNMVEVGTHDAITREEWWYPTYVEEVCPGLPDWKALDACADKFATAETAPKGRFVGPPADWGKHYGERIAALKMNFTEVPVGQAATLWAELQAAYDRKEPIVLFNWTPNFIEAKFEGKFVEFPDYDPACHEDPAWGENPDAIYDCGAPKKGFLKKAAWKGMQEKWPAAYEFFTKVNFTNPQIAKAASMVDVDGLTPEEAATKWIEDNEAVWSTWMPAS
jgi:glycine betaine/proline transport system substrate-binding protein